MKEDILEQLVDDWLRFQGYFTLHNVKFKPNQSWHRYNARLHSVPSDIDVIGYHPGKNGTERVLVCTCKSYENGFNPNDWSGAVLNPSTIRSGVPAWKKFHELGDDIWSRAFREQVEKVTGQTDFTYIVAVTRLSGRFACPLDFTECEEFIERIGNNRLRILTLDNILTDIWPDIGRQTESSQLASTLRLLKASNWRPNR